MRRYIAKRVVYSLIVVWGVATVVFFGMRALPGGPARTMLGVEATEEAVRELRNQMGLDRPLWVQYIDWMVDLVTFQFGNSLSSGKTIQALIANAGPKTLSIALVGVAVGLSIALPAGVISALYRGQGVDYVATIVAFLGLSMPAFFVGIVLAVVFGVWLGVLPVFGYQSLDQGIVPWFKHILLPGIAVGTPYAAIIMRMMRSQLLEVMGSQYIKTAKAKGVDARVRLYKHAIQNAMISVVTVAGIQLALIVIGSVTVELVFGIKGIGRMFVDSMLTRDYPVAQVVIVLTSAVLVFTNLFVDIVYTLIDPRIRYGSEEAGA